MNTFCKGEFQYGRSMPLICDREKLFQKTEKARLSGGEIRLQSFWRPDVNNRFPDVEVGDSIPSDWPIAGL
jgi:hypothetical protein